VIVTAAAVRSTGAIWLKGEEAAQRSEARHFAFFEIPTRQIERSDRFTGEVPLSTVMADGRSYAQRSNIITHADKLLDVLVLEVGRAAACALGERRALQAKRLPQQRVSRDGTALQQHLHRKGPVIDE
jgi:hypothetical protein